jgi:Zn-dependent protease
MDGLQHNHQHPNLTEEIGKGDEGKLVARPGESLADVEDEAPSSFSEWTLPIILFLLTVFTTLWAGAYQAYQGPVRGPLNFLLTHPETLWRGIPFAASLLFILTTHELGHYLLSMRGTDMNRRALFDIGVAGPLAGFVVAVVVLIVGLSLSTVVDRTATYGLHLGEPLLLQFMSWLVIGTVPPDSDVVLHPIGFAAWFGLFVTSLNLLPIGQLDGGHVAYALWGRWQRSMALVFVVILIGLGFVGWPGWFLWAFMAGIWGVGHPPVADPVTPLGRSRTIVGAPIPFSFH